MRSSVFYHEAAIKKERKNLNNVNERIEKEIGLFRNYYD
jgi:hypothetical protein